MGVSFYKLQYCILFLLCFVLQGQRTTGLVVTIRTAKFNCIWSSQYICVPHFSYDKYYPIQHSKVGLSNASRQCSV